MQPIFRDVSIIPVVTIDRAADGAPLARALVRGGLHVIEVTLRTAEAPAAIAAIARDVPEATVGAEGSWNVNVWLTTPVERLTWAMLWLTPGWGRMAVPMRKPSVA